MDIDDLAGSLSTVAAVLRPGGWFAASIVHPCFPGNELGCSRLAADRAAADLDKERNIRIVGFAPRENRW
jgi:hypothetical protein